VAATPPRNYTVAELTDIYNEMGQDIFPDVMPVMFPDTMTVIAETITKDSQGRAIKSSTANAYTSVPVGYDTAPMGWGNRRIQGDRSVSVQEYILTFPTHTSAGTRIDLDPEKHRLVVDARGNEPAKTFRIMSITDNVGAFYEVLCEREG